MPCARATLVDVIGGGLAATTAHPNWIATADLTLHMIAAAKEGVVEARAQILRAGRTTIVLEVQLHVARVPVGIATMSFSVLPRRRENPDLGATRPAGPSLPVREWATNSMGALQGGVVGVVVEAAAEVALRHATGEPHRFPRSTGPLKIDARVLRKGRNNVVTSVEIVDAATDRLVMDGVLTSAILVPENGPPVWERPLHIEFPGDDIDYLPMDRWLDHRIVSDTAIEMDLRDTLRNPWGILHGGVVAALVDAAGEHATRGGVTTDVVVHYLAPNRLGPVRATVSVLGTRSDGVVVRVEIRDEGAARVTAVAVATVAPQKRQRV